MYIELSNYLKISKYKNLELLEEWKYRNIEILNNRYAETLKRQNTLSNSSILFPENKCKHLFRKHSKFLVKRISLLIFYAAAEFHYKITF